MTGTPDDDTKDLGPGSGGEGSEEESAGAPRGDTDDDPFATGGALGGGLFRQLAENVGARSTDLPTDPALDPLIGKTVDGYRIEERLGIGGMGVVYRAIDLKLSRPVALKFLPSHMVETPRAHERFEREARAVSQLTHPNICVLHGVGEHDDRPYLVLELLEGETLSEKLRAGPIEPGRALEIAAAIADGLETAHDAGVLHRDIKPANLFITKRGHVKILDFGIAKLMPHGELYGAEAGGGEEDPGTLTQPGTVPGTYAYMSPEQLRGEDLDERSDLFSLGVVLYQMIAGHPPFEAASPALMIDAILRDSPPRLSGERTGLDPRVEELVEWAMERDRRRRVTSAGRFRASLESLRWSLVSGSEAARLAAGRQRGWRAEWREIVLGALAVVAMVSVFTVRGCGSAGSEAGVIAVMPFENLAPESDPLLEATLPDELVGLLSRSRELTVRPYSQSRALAAAGDASDLDSVAEQLGARHLVTGRIVPRDGRVEVVLEAVAVAHGRGAQRVVWRETLALDPDDLLAQRERLRDSVRDGLLPALGLTPPDDATLPASSEAYRLYVESRAALGDPEPNRAAISKLERAVELDPTFAPAWAQLGMLLHIDGYYWGGGREQLARARRAVERALELDPELIEASSTLVELRLEDGDHLGAYRAASELLDRRATSAASHVLLATTLRYGGLLEEAVGECEVARGIDPRDAAQRQCVMTYLWAGLPDRAIDVAAFATSLLWENDVTARIALMNGRREEAARLWSRQGSAEAGLLRRDQFAACLRDERGDELDALLDEAYERVNAVADPEWWFASAGLFAVCGKDEWTLALLDRAVRTGYCVDPSVSVDPLLRPVADRLEPTRRVASACRERFAAQIR